MVEKYFFIYAYVWLIFAVVIHIVMFFVTAPFGRHTSTKWGAMINNKAAWVIMELPSLAIMAYFFFGGSGSKNSYAYILFGLWILHYVNRTFIYPIRIKATPKKMPVLIMAGGIFFNCNNAFLNGYYLAEMADPLHYSAAWLRSPYFIAGILLFFGGMAVNLISDNILIHLRKPGQSGYKIPHGFLFEYVSSPNLFGEIIEWAGFALMAWNIPALTFAVWTYANLLPRAKNHHDWYLRSFPDYPKNRKIIFPFLY